MAQGTAAVTAGAASVTITGVFPASYQVEITPNWLTTYAVSGKTSAQFVVSFGTVAPAAATVDWIVTSGTGGNVANLLTSIRAQIPDPVANVANDGTAFSAATLIGWINDAARIMATRAPIVQDWSALQSLSGQMTYPLPANLVTIEQLWYDLESCSRAAELDSLGTAKITARSYVFGPHSVGASPVLHVYPACDRTGQTTTINNAGGLTASDTSLVVASVSSFQTYGYLTIDAELIKYETVTSSTSTFSNLLRGQGGTVAAAHANGATVTENNLFFRCSRLPATVSGATDTLEIPLGLLPLIELYVLARVRQNEQEHRVSLELSQAFDAQVDRLAVAYAPRGHRHGLQVRGEPPGPYLYFGRVMVP